MVTGAGAAALSALDVWAWKEEVHDVINPEEEGWELDTDTAKSFAQKIIL